MPTCLKFYAPTMPKIPSYLAFTGETQCLTNGYKLYQIAASKDFHIIGLENNSSKYDKSYKTPILIKKGTIGGWISKSVIISEPTQSNSGYTWIDSDSSVMGKVQLRGAVINNSFIDFTHKNQESNITDNIILAYCIIRNSQIVGINPEYSYKFTMQPLTYTKYVAHINIIINNSLLQVSFGNLDIYPDSELIIKESNIKTTSFKMLHSYIKCASCELINCDIIASAMLELGNERIKITNLYARCQSLIFNSSALSPTSDSSSGTRAVIKGKTISFWKPVLFPRYFYLSTNKIDDFGIHVPLVKSMSTLVITNPTDIQQLSLTISPRLKSYAQNTITLCIFRNRHPTKGNLNWKDYTLSIAATGAIDSNIRLDKVTSESLKEALKSLIIKEEAELNMILNWLELAKTRIANTFKEETK